MKISVILPMYNAAAYLPACLDSLIAQSLGDFEIIAVDDASTDKTPGIIAAYAARDKRITPIRHEKNANSFETRLTALERATGDYIFCCDADDIVPSDSFQTLLDAAERSGADIVHGRTLLFSDADAGETAYWVEPFRVATGRDFVRAMLRNGRGWNVWAKLFSTRAVKKALPLFPRGRNWFTLDDLLSSCLIGLHADGYHGIEDPVYHYRIPPVTHSTRSGGIEKWATDSLGIMACLEDTVARMPDMGKELRAVGGFMHDCITGAVTEAAANSDDLEKVSAIIRATVKPEHVLWAERERLPGFSPPRREGKILRTARRLIAAARRIAIRGVRESYLRIQTKALFNRWEQEYEAALARGERKEGSR